MEVTEIFDQVAGFFAAAAVVAFLLLLPLYFSQRRDVRRMRGWMELEPEYPPADIESSEVLLDRAEIELEELLGLQQETGTDDTVVAPAAAQGDQRAAGARADHDGARGARSRIPAGGGS